MSYDLNNLSNRWLYNCIGTVSFEPTPDRILSVLSVLDGEWKLPFMIVTEKIDEEFLIFSDEAVFILDDIESSGMDGKWKIE